MGLIIIFKALICFLIGILLVSCNRLEKSQQEVPPNHINNPAIQAISVEIDERYEDKISNDPYQTLSPYIHEIYEIDRNLYNAIFVAINRHEASLDITAYDLDYETIRMTSESLYEQGGMQLYYLKRIQWNEDFSKLYFTYNEDAVQMIRHNQELFYGKLNHLINNVAPKFLNEYQQFFAIYDYIGSHAVIKDSIHDTATMTPYGLLVNGEGNSDAFAKLTDIVLKYIGIPSIYIRNDSHVWNMVMLGNQQYHTDVAWGAGYTEDHYINTVLMSDDIRIQGLNERLEANQPIYIGYPGGKEMIPPQASSEQYDTLYDVYFQYGLDIENEWLYFINDRGIQRIKLDGNNREEVVAGTYHMLTVYNGTVYYQGEDSKELYRWQENQLPELIDDSSTFYRMYVKNGILYYGTGINDTLEKFIDLNEFSVLPRELIDIHPEEYRLSRGDTFQIRISFDKPMNNLEIPEDLVGIVGEDHRSIPYYGYWEDNSKEFVIRPKEFLFYDNTLTVYIKSGIMGREEEQTIDEKILILKYQ